ncbi:MAG: sulfur oxidation c-type cytochrome SoxA [Gammaproteobacteria bacterium]|nr:sulfur oxidation c-type cytochrome SoxA [Gammaproteobacteria bacterium]
MRKYFTLTIITTVLLSCLPAAFASPESDRHAFRNYYFKLFPKVAEKDFADGVYMWDNVARENWELIEEFPPYETNIDAGKRLWNAPFSNGKSYASCFKKPGVTNQFPRWDKEQQSVITLPLAINQCRESNGEKPLKYLKGDIADLLAYMAYESRGQLTKVEIPNDPGALSAYEKGKHFYYARRGQLNFSCAHCHQVAAGKFLRTESLSPSLGQHTNWPVYRSKWNELGTLHRRFIGCNNQVRAKPFEAQSEEYRNLEYFLTYMGNGLPLNGPSTRR